MIDEIVVPLDGSDFANRALPVAAALSSALEARLRVIGIASSDVEFAETHLAVHEAVDRGRLHGIDVEVLIDPHPVDGLLATGAAEGTVLCLGNTRRSGPGGAGVARRRVARPRAERAADRGRRTASVRRLARE